MTKEIIHSLILIATIVLAFIFPKTNLANYELQITAGLFVILYLVKKLVVSQSSSSRLIESVIFTLIIVGIVNSTGGVNSLFFFLIYFLLFSLSLLLEPIISITTTITLVVFFLLSVPQGQNWKNLLPIISLAFITPFAMFLGEEYKRSEKLEVKSEKLQEDAFLFVSLLLKNHLKNIKEAVENFVGDHELDIIKKSASRMEKLIEKFEKS
ncbi:hypothetical protein COY13_04230 [Candidatus Roizmanbacteria bacterium CG_4_10_14_0_2_um_filter_36_35]|uniref:Uncharacterized protein n=3 Tax=Candidatus Roizmaniibacteriota TaxID=1752723 RepID=A0A2M7BVP6_9BACT|nr:MAG: hypothetical protein COV86_02855 [Candidatus Roizmanbacteria bacterium CG11_big_fil_rev_8_21_14_0_20_35_14]PIV10628.1 MAG: hypothetical protein COS50_04465 [Candidatus Roizmanbacteria bacterium CG03_land_8_20_14_0_80_35_26]PIZ67023.1 MAG: hypothetical protein COY13_04230 [Candidatus Roizmanbacteria bacterium CG_4_10_14_0_2_um_filter_36_35]PJC80576.1 MAG: hypothetical protein CO008_01520 [Candidatus Roizmanbacteria bacterium CG_4_8_14_3_um_filter_36_12]